MIRNDALGKWDYLGLAPKKDCVFTMWVGHSTTLVLGISDFVSGLKKGEYKGGSFDGDRIVAITCNRKTTNKAIEEELPEKAVPGDDRPDNSIFPQENDGEAERDKRFKEGDEKVSQAFRRELKRFREVVKKDMCKKCKTIRINVVGVDDAGKHWVTNNAPFFMEKEKMKYLQKCKEK